MNSKVRFVMCRYDARMLRKTAGDVSGGRCKADKCSFEGRTLSSIATIGVFFMKSLKLVTGRAEDWICDVIRTKTRI